MAIRDSDATYRLNHFGKFLQAYPWSFKIHFANISVIFLCNTPEPGFVGSDKVTSSAQLAGQPQNFDFFTFNITVTQ